VATRSKVKRAVIGFAKRVKYAADQTAVSLDLFETSTAMRIAAASLRGRASVHRVSPIGFDRVVAVRVGRRSSDLAVLRDVVRTAAYDVDIPLEPHWIIDAGANVGYSALWFADRYPNATIVAIEPDVDNYEVMLQNIADEKRILPLRGALADFSGDGELVDPGLGAWGIRLRQPQGLQPGERVLGRVDCFTVADVMTMFGIDEVGLLKVDIEGGEVELFSGDLAWLDRVDAITAELHDRHRPGCARAFCAATAAFPNTAGRSENIFVWR